MPNLFLDLYYYLVDYTGSEDFQRGLLWVKVASLGISLLLIVTIIILLSRSRATWWIGERVDSFRKVKLPQRQLQQWEKIQQRLEKADEANLKLAVIEADNLLDEIFKRMGLLGKDMGERLDQMNQQQLAALDEIREAHRLRDLIVRQSDIKIGQQEAQKAIEAYEKALKELEVL